MGKMGLGTCLCWSSEIHGTMSAVRAGSLMDGGGGAHGYGGIVSLEGKKSGRISPRNDSPRKSSKQARLERGFEGIEGS